MLYSCISIQEINCAFVKTKETIYDVVVVDKSHVSGRSPYYIYIEPKYTDREMLGVSSKTYSKIHKYDKIKIISCKGILGLGWYTVV